MNKPNILSVLLVIDSLGSGGAQRQMVTLAGNLVKRGHKVSLFMYYPEIAHFRSEIEGLQIKILGVNKRFRFDPRPCFALRKIISTGRFDSVLSFLNTPNIYTILATLGNRRLKPIVSERKMFPDGRLEPSVWMRYQTYRFTQAVTVNSYHQYERVLRYFPWAEPKLHTIWNGVDLTRFAPGSRSKLPRDSTIHMIAIATIVDWKNAYNLIKALHLVRAAGVQLHIDWAGRVLSQENSQREFERCRDLIKQLRLERDWQWLGVVKNMHSVYSNYDALAHPSFVEGLPNVICEALASGLPVLASAVCDHPLLIEAGENGLLFDPSDPRSIADTLLTFCRMSKGEQLAMGQRAREFAERELSVDKMVDSYEQLLRQEHSER